MVGPFELPRIIPNLTPELIRGAARQKKNRRLRRNTVLNQLNQETEKKSP